MNKYKWMLADERYTALNREVKQTDLYFSHRYRNGSYKFRKAGIQPIRIGVKAKFDDEAITFRVYGDVGKPMTRDQEALAKRGARVLRQKYGELKRLDRAKVKSGAILKSYPY